MKTQSRNYKNTLETKVVFAKACLYSPKGDKCVLSSAKSTLKCEVMHPESWRGYPLQLKVHI